MRSLRQARRQQTTACTRREDDSISRTRGAQARRTVKSEMAKQSAAMGIDTMIPERNERGGGEDEETIAVDAGGTLACEGQGDEMNEKNNREALCYAVRLCATVLTVIVILH